MEEKVLTDIEVLEIVYNWDENFRDSSSDSVGSSDIEILKNLKLAINSFVSGTVRNFIKIHTSLLSSPPPFNFLTRVGWARRSPRTQPVLASLPL